MTSASSVMEVSLTERRRWRPERYSPLVEDWRFIITKIRVVFFSQLLQLFARSSSMRCKLLLVNGCV